MKQQQGFSLIEVLLSLMLMATVALNLMQQQGSIIQYFHHLSQTSKTANFIHNRIELARVQQP